MLQNGFGQIEAIFVHEITLDSIFNIDDKQ